MLAVGVSLDYELHLSNTQSDFHGARYIPELMLLRNDTLSISCSNGRKCRDHGEGKVKWSLSATTPFSQATIRLGRMRTSSSNEQYTLSETPHLFLSRQELLFRLSHINSIDNMTWKDILELKSQVIFCTSTPDHTEYVPSPLSIETFQNASQDSSKCSHIDENSQSPRGRTSKSPRSPQNRHDNNDRRVRADPRRPSPPARRSLLRNNELQRSRCE